MEKSIKKKIKELVLNKKIGSIDKLIAIYKIIYGNEGLGSLAKALDVSELFLAEWEISEIPKDLKPTKSMLSQYIDVFTEYHKKIHDRGFDYDKKEIGQLNNCIKKFKNIDTWRHFLILIERANNQKLAGKIIKSTWLFIIQSLKPSTIYNQRNFILNEEQRVEGLLKSQPKMKKEWNW